MNGKFEIGDEVIDVLQPLATSRVLLSSKRGRCVDGALAGGGVLGHGGLLSSRRAAPSATRPGHGDVPRLRSNLLGDD